LAPTSSNTQLPTFSTRDVTSTRQAMQTKKQKNNLRKQGSFIYDLEDWKYNRETPTQNLKKMRMNFDEKKEETATRPSPNNMANPDTYPTPL